MGVNRSTLTFSAEKAPWDSQGRSRGGRRSRSITTSLGRRGLATAGRVPEAPYGLVPLQLGGDDPSGPYRSLCVPEQRADLIGPRGVTTCFEGRPRAKHNAKGACQNEFESNKDPVREPAGRVR